MRSLFSFFAASSNNEEEEEEDDIDEAMSAVEKGGIGKMVSFESAKKSPGWVVVVERFKGTGVTCGGAFPNCSDPDRKLSRPYSLLKHAADS